MKLVKLKNPYLIVSIFSSFILLSLIVFFYIAREKIISRNLVEHSHQVIDNSHDLLIDLVSHQTGIRGYIITSDTNFLEPYKTSLPSAKKHFTELKILTIDNLLQQNQLNKLGKLINQRNELSNKIILQIKEFPFNINQQISTAEEGKKINDEAKLLITKIIDEENKLLAERQTTDENKDKN